MILTPYISRTLGAEVLGAYGYASSIATYFVIAAEFGTSYYAQKEIAMWRNDTEKVKHIFSDTVKFRFYMAFCMAVIYVGLVHRINESWIFIICVLNILAIISDISWFYIGYEKFRVIVLRNFIVKIVSLIYIFLNVKTPEDIYKYVLGIQFLNITCNFTLWKGCVPELLVKKKLEFYKYMKKTAPFFLSVMIMQIYPLIDKTMIGYLVNNHAQVGYYTQVQAIVKSFIMLVVSVGTVLAPRISYHYNRKENEQVVNYMYISFKFVYLVSLPIVAGMIAIAEVFIPWFLGKEYIDCVVLLKIFAPYLICNSMIYVVNTQLLIPTNNQNIVTIVMSLGCIVNIGLNTYFIPKFQAYGAALATIISEFLVMMVLLIYINYAEYNIQIKKVISDVKIYFISSILMYVLVSLLWNCINNVTLKLFLKIITGIVIYLMSLFCVKERIVISGFRSIRKCIMKIL